MKFTKLDGRTSRTKVVVELFDFCFEQSRFRMSFLRCSIHVRAVSGFVSSVSTTSVGCAEDSAIFATNLSARNTVPPLSGLPPVLRRGFTSVFSNRLPSSSSAALNQPKFCSWRQLCSNEDRQTLLQWKGAQKVREPLSTKLIIFGRFVPNQI